MGAAEIAFRDLAVLEKNLLRKKERRAADLIINRIYIPFYL
jgi:hypothetical protein